MKKSTSISRIPRAYNPLSYIARKRKLGKRGYLGVLEKLAPYLSLAFLIGLTEFLVIHFEVKAYILPKPSSVVQRLIEDRELLWMHTQTTLYEAGVGFAIAVGLAIVLAVIMSKVPVLKAILYPLLVISQTVPIVALAPILVIWFGFGLLPKILVVVLVCFFPVVVSLTEGLGVVDQEMVYLMKSMNAKRYQIFLRVEVPSVLPAFFSGLKISATYAIMGAVIAEWLGAQSGLGIYMTRARKAFKTDALFADICIIVAVSILLFKTIDIIGRVCMPWQKGEK